MNIQLRPRSETPEIGLIVVRTSLLLLTLGLSFYFFHWLQNSTYAVATFGGGLLLFFAVDVVWPRAIPLVIINESGILDRRLGIGVIRWEDILEAQIEMDGKFICLRVQNPESYVSKFPSEKRQKMEFHQSLGFRMLNIEVQGLEVNVLRTVELIRKRIRQTL